MQTYSIYLNGLLWCSGMDMETAFALTLETALDLEAERDTDNG